MHHDNPRAFAFDGVVIGVVADQLGAVGALVGDFLSLDRSLGEAADSEQREGEEQAHGRSPLISGQNSLVDLVQVRFRERSGSVQGRVSNLAPYPNSTVKEEIP